MKSIGNFVPDSPFFLAPMAGFTDLAFRTLCSKMGAPLAYTVMVSCKGLYYGDRKSRSLLRIGEEEGPVAYQIFGNDPDIMAWAAEELDRDSNVILDINMGCPVPKVVKNGEGSALLRNPELIYKIVKKVSGATDKPVTIKMRIGIEGAPEKGFVDCAKAAEEGGASAVAVHGRTREEYYSGKVHLDAIKEVRDAISIPLIGNGDILSFDDAKHMMEYTGCDFVMIGRGALGNPWIFKRLVSQWRGEDEPAPPSKEEIVAAMVEHYDNLEATKGEYIGVREMRKFVGRYLKGVEGSLRIRRLTNTIESGEELKQTLLSIIEG